MTGLPTYSVVDWDKNFENNRTKELRSMTWVPVPNKQDGDGYTELLDHPDGASHFGTWIAIVQVASKCAPRGTLVRECRGDLRRPHDAASLSRITRIPVHIVQSALDRLVEIGWLSISLQAQSLTALPHTAAVIPQLDAAPPQEDAVSRARGKGREGKGIEGTGREGKESTSSHAHEGAASPNQPPGDDQADCLDQIKTALEAPDGYPAGHLGGLGGGLAQALFTAWRAGWIRPDGTSPPNGGKSMTCSEVLASLGRWKLWWEQSSREIPNARNWIERGVFLEPAPTWKPKSSREVDVRRAAGAHATLPPSRSIRMVDVLAEEAKKGGTST